MDRLGRTAILLYNKVFNHEMFREISRHVVFVQIILNTEQQSSIIFNTLDTPRRNNNVRAFLWG